MFTKQSIPQRYEAPSVRVHLFSAESGFASSVDGYNEQGLFDFSGENVHDQTNDWGI